MEKKKWAGWIVLVTLVLVAAVALAVTNAVTEQRVADQNLAGAQEGLKKIFPDAEEGAKGFEPIPLEEGSGLDFAYIVKKGPDVIGYAGKTTAQGYGGPVEVTVGIAPEGPLKGIYVGGANFKETEGLGSKAKEEPFLGQFAGKQPPMTLGDNVDAISGATVTSRAVAEGVNTAYEKLTVLVGIVPGQSPGGSAQPAANGRAVNASVIGYGGPVLVQLTLDDSGVITAIAVGGARFAETDGVGSKVKEAAFTQQFVGKKPPLSMGDVDAVSGATVSSQAVVDAVNAAYGFLNE